MRSLVLPRRRARELGPGAEIHRGKLGEAYDGIGQYVLVTLASSSVGSAYKARIASGDFGGGRTFPRGTPVSVVSYRGNLEVFLGNVGDCEPLEYPSLSRNDLLEYDNTGNGLGWGVIGYIHANTNFGADSNMSAQRQVRHFTSYDYYEERSIATLELQSNATKVRLYADIWASNGYSKSGMTPSTQSAAWRLALTEWTGIINDASSFYVLGTAEAGWEPSGSVVSTGSGTFTLGDDGINGGLGNKIGTVDIQFQLMPLPSLNPTIGYRYLQLHLTNISPTGCCIPIGAKNWYTREFGNNGDSKDAASVINLYPGGYDTESDAFDAFQNGGYYTMFEPLFCR